MNNVLLLKACVYRNMKDYKFTNKLEGEKRMEIMNKLSNSLKEDMQFYSSDANLTGAVKDIKSKGLIIENCDEVFYNLKNRIAINMFAGEHITIVSTAVGYDTDVYKKVKAISDNLMKEIPLAYNDKYGYLMSDVRKIGPAIYLECDIALPAIESLGKINQVITNIRNLGYDIRRSDKEKVYKLSTRCGLGYTENEIIDEFTKMVNKLQDIEVESLKMVDMENHDKLYDAFERSLALLIYAHMMHPNELQNHINNLRMGVNLNFASLSEQTINQLQNLVNKYSNEAITKEDLISLATGVRQIMT